MLLEWCSDLGVGEWAARGPAPLASSSDILRSPAPEVPYRKVKTVQVRRSLRRVPRVRYSDPVPLSVVVGARGRSTEPVAPGEISDFRSPDSVCFSQVRNL